MGKQTTPLRQRMIEDMTIRNMSPSSKKIYVRAVANFSIYHGRSPDKLVLCRTLLHVPAAEASPTNRDEREAAPVFERPACPCCGGRMKVIESFDGAYSRPFHARRADSS